MLLYLRITWSSECRQDNELDSRSKNWKSKCSKLYRSVVLKRELCTKAKLSVFRSVFVPILTYSHECCVMTERVRFQVRYPFKRASYKTASYKRAGTK